MAFKTSRRSTLRGLPPRLAGGISGSTRAHSGSVRSLDNADLDGPPHDDAPASTCALSDSSAQGITTDSAHSTSSRIGSKSIQPQEVTETSNTGELILIVRKPDMLKDTMWQF